MNRGAFGIRARRLRIIAPHPPATRGLPFRVAHFASCFWRLLGEPPPPVLMRQRVGLGLSPLSQSVLAPGLAFEWHSVKTVLASCREHGGKANRQPWGVHPRCTRSSWRFSGRKSFGSAATCRRFWTRRQVVEFTKPDPPNITKNFGMHGSPHRAICPASTAIRRGQNL